MYIFIRNWSLGRSELLAIIVEISSSTTLVSQVLLHISVADALIWNSECISTPIVPRCHEIALKLLLLQYYSVHQLSQLLWLRLVKSLNYSALLGFAFAVQASNDEQLKGSASINIMKNRLLSGFNGLLGIIKRKISLFRK